MQSHSMDRVLRSWAKWVVFWSLLHKFIACFKLLIQLNNVHSSRLSEFFSTTLNPDIIPRASSKCSTILILSSSPGNSSSSNYANFWILINCFTFWNYFWLFYWVVSGANEISPILFDIINFFVFAGSFRIDYRKAVDAIYLNI